MRFVETFLELFIRFVALFIVGFAIGGLYSSIANASNPSVYRLRPIDKMSSGGTGFLVEVKGTKMILTNRHVCEITDGGAFAAERGGTTYGAIVVAVSQTDDLCLLRPSKSIDGRALTIANYDVLPTTLVYSEGYPALANQVKSVGILQAIETAPSNYIEGAFVTMGKTTFRAIPGMSGSPVFDMHQQVVGVIARLSLIDSHSTLFVTGDRVRAFLSSSNTKVSVKDRVRSAALQASIKYGVRYDLLLAIIAVESSFNPLAIGGAGEIGVMQLHPKYHTPVLGDVESNVDQGTRFLRYIRDELTDSYEDAWFVGFNYGPSRRLSNPKETEYYKRVTKVLGGSL